MVGALPAVGCAVAAACRLVPGAPLGSAAVPPLGVYAYRGLLRAVGWERLRRQAQGFKGTQASLRHYERRTREAEFSHVVLGGITLGLVLISDQRGQWDTAWWLLVTGLLFHTYPVMLQRTLRERLQRLGVSV